MTFSHLARGRIRKSVKICSPFFGFLNLFLSKNSPMPCKLRAYVGSACLTCKGSTRRGRPRWLVTPYYPYFWAILIWYCLRPARWEILTTCWSLWRLKFCKKNAFAFICSWIMVLDSQNFTCFKCSLLFLPRRIKYSATKHLPFNFRRGFVGLRILYGFQLGQ